MFKELIPIKLYCITTSRVRNVRKTFIYPTICL